MWWKILAVVTLFVVTLLIKFGAASAIGAFGVWIVIPITAPFFLAGYLIDRHDRKKLRDRSR